MTPSMPAFFAPMLASSVEEPFDSPDHLFEVKWDGVRTLAFCEESRTRLYSRSGRDVTRQYPEFADIHERLTVDSAVLDGEIVALDEAGRPSFERLQSRINLSRATDITRAVSDISLDLVLFDCAFLDGGWIGSRGIEERLELLQGAFSFGDRVLRSEPIPQAGVALFEAAAARGLEGIVAKRYGSHYLPGKRTRDWLKIKVVHQIDCVIGGWTRGFGGRGDSLGSLLLGLYEDDALRFIGAVGTGFDAKGLASMRKIVEELKTDAMPFADLPPVKAAGWVRPELVCVVEYRELTHGYRLRAPSFKGLRTDKDPSECLMPSEGA